MFTNKKNSLFPSLKTLQQLYKSSEDLYNCSNLFPLQQLCIPSNLSCWMIAILFLVSLDSTSAQLDLNLITCQPHWGLYHLFLLKLFLLDSVLAYHHAEIQLFLKWRHFLLISCGNLQHSCFCCRNSGYRKSVSVPNVEGFVKSEKLKEGTRWMFTVVEAFTNLFYIISNIHNWFSWVLTNLINRNCC